MRSATSRASLAKASVAFRRESFNLFFALKSASRADSSRSAISNVLIRSARQHALSPAWVVAAPCSLLDLALSRTLYINPIPSSKKLILASKSFFDNPSNLDLISSISRTINPRNFWSVTSPSFRCSAAYLSAFIHKQTNSEFKNSCRNRRHNLQVKTFKILLFCCSAQSRSYPNKSKGVSVS